ncbi:MAG: tyrosine-type recombinase/integrase, partial [Prevotella sp.]|nr:tyrosine-type recombinase/integrase [Prevotella sp.]
SEDSDYIFPLLTDNNNDRAYLCLLARYNRALAKIAGMAGIETKITSYTARHTWASIAYRIGGNLGAISKALTHTSPVTTQNYLKEFDDMGVFKLAGDVMKKIWPQISTF